MRLRPAALIAAAVAIAAAGFVVFRSAGGTPDAAADGAYWHDCCGTVTLTGGRMTLGESKQQVPYELGTDEAGPYLLPSTYVGTWEDRGFQTDGSRPAEKLRLDRLPHPDTIRLSDIGRSYTFKRGAGRAR
ncbi:MAG TPA: hypothetical protein VGB62_03095 [Allosphingosinicella sp.]|jgi:hypothetical protein